MIQRNKSAAYYEGALHCLYQYAHWQNGIMFVGTTGRTYDAAANEITDAKLAASKQDATADKPAPMYDPAEEAPGLMVMITQNIRANLINLVGSLSNAEDHEEIMRRAHGLGADVSAAEARVMGNRRADANVCRGDLRLLVAGLLRCCLKALEETG